MKFSKWKELRELQDSNHHLKRYLESNENEPAIMHVNIPVDQEVYELHKFLSSGDPNVQLYIVGGAVRDFLYHKHNGASGTTYKHKDIDLTTNLSEEEILRRLGPGSAAAQAGVKVKEKESVDTFGVVFVYFNGNDYEIAPFRKDIGSVDGRRPDRVEQAGVYEDAMRRDLTINNLYYDFNKKYVLDFNDNGQGIQDIKNGVARPVGDPFERFGEDKLRVLRLVRFFSRFNNGKIVDILDDKTLRAVENFKNLQFHGITPERILDEFVKGISQAQSTTAYLENYIDLDLMDAVFPGLNVDTQSISPLENTRNPRVIYAWLLRKNPNVDKQLHQLKYETGFSRAVQFLIEAMNIDPAQIQRFVNIRDKRLPEVSRATIKQDLAELATISGHPEIARKLMHFSTYEPPKIDSQELMKQGFQGPEIGKEIDHQMTQHYDRSLGDYQ